MPRVALDQRIAPGGKEGGDRDEQAGFPGDHEFRLPAIASGDDVAGEPLRIKAAKLHAAAGLENRGGKIGRLIRISWRSVFAADRAGANEQRVNPFAGKFEAELLGIGGERELRGGISADERAGEFAGERADQDNAAAGFFQQRLGRLRATNGRKKIDFPERLKIFRGRFDHFAAGAFAGVVDEHIEPAEAGFDFGK